MVLQGVLASQEVGGTFGPPCLVLWNLDPVMASLRLEMPMDRTV